MKESLARAAESWIEASPSDLKKSLYLVVDLANFFPRKVKVWCISEIDIEFLRQYLALGCDISIHNQQNLDAIAKERSTRSPQKPS